MEIALTYLYGIGRTRSGSGGHRHRPGPAHQGPHRRPADPAARLHRKPTSRSGDLRREVQTDIRRKIEIGCYQGPAAPSRPAGDNQPSGPTTNAPARAPSAPSPERRPGNPDATKPKRPRPPQEDPRPRRRRKEERPARRRPHQGTFNNTIVSITDPQGNVIAWASSGHVGFKGSRKVRPFAAQLAAENAARKAQRSTASKKVDVFVKGRVQTADRDPARCCRRPRGRRHFRRHPPAADGCRPPA